MKSTRQILASLAVAAGAISLIGSAQAADVEAAKALAQQNNCLKCHGVEKDKDGPAFKKTAGKYKGKADAEDKLVTHLTTGPKIKFEDGTEEDHKIVKTTPPKDMAQVKNLVQWILSL